MNDTIRTICSRRTAHSFRADPVPEDVIASALECAIRAPNHKLTNPWRFTRVGPVSRAAIVELGVRLKAERGGLSDAQLDKIRATLSSAPVLLIARQVLSDDAIRRREDYASCACAIQNMSLALWSAGVSSKWSSGAVTSDPLTYAIAGVDPAREEIIGFVWVGYAEPQPETPRRAVRDITHSIP